MKWTWKKSVHSQNGKKGEIGFVEVVAMEMHTFSHTKMLDFDWITQTMRTNAQRKMAWGATRLPCINITFYFYVSTHNHHLCKIWAVSGIRV